MNRELRIRAFQIICYVLMFSGLLLFSFGLNIKDFISPRYLPASYAFIAMSGFACTASVMVAEKVFPIMLFSLLFGCMLVVFGFIHLIPH